MPSEIEISIAEMFSNATRQNMVTELRTQDDWDQFKAIDETARQRTRDEIDGYERDRPLRLAAARKDIIDEAGSLTFEHPTPFGTNKFDKDEIERQAVARVFNDHQSTLMGIKADEVEAYDTLCADIHVREDVRDFARDAFERAGKQTEYPQRSRSGPAR